MDLEKSKGDRPVYDYNEEARKLWARLGDTPGSRFNNLDPIHESKEGGFIFVGGDTVSLLIP